MTQTHARFHLRSVLAWVTLIAVASAGMWSWSSFAGVLATFAINTVLISACIALMLRGSHVARIFAVGALGPLVVGIAVPFVRVAAFGTVQNITEVNNGSRWITAGLWLLALLCGVAAVTPYWDDGGG